MAVTPEQVRIRVRDREHPGTGKRTLALAANEFIGRFVQHVLPPGLKRIRHYGLLSPAVKARRLAAARRALAMPPPNPQAVQDVAVFMQRVAGVDIGRCEHCGRGRWRLLGPIAPVAAAAPHTTWTRPARGPPP